MTGASLSRPLPRIRVHVHRLLLPRAISSTPASKRLRANPSIPSVSDSDEELRKQRWQQAQWQRDLGPKPGIANILPDQHRPPDYVSKRVRAVVNQHDWGFPPETRRLSIKGVRGGNPCNVSIYASHRHCFDSQVMPWLSRDPHPYVQSILDRHIADEDKPLWVYPRVQNPNGSIAPFVVSTAKRRTKRCVRLALEECGYDIHGRSLRPGKEGAAPRQLFGTIRVFVAEPLKLCQMSDANILSFMKPIVDVAVMELTLGVNRSHGPRQGQNRWQQRGQPRFFRLPEKQGRDPELSGESWRRQGQGFNQERHDGFNQQQQQQQHREARTDRNNEWRQQEEKAPRRKDKGTGPSYYHRIKPNPSVDPSKGEQT